MPFCRESVNSPNPRSDGTIERIFIVEGTTDDKEAEDIVFGFAETTYRGLFRSALPDTKATGRGIFECTFIYKPQGEDENNKIGRASCRERV